MSSFDAYIASLPVKNVCVSPMRRAQDTKEIITLRLQEMPHHAIDQLSECSAKTWDEMRALGMYIPVPEKGNVRHFMDRVREGINKALALPGPSLIVAHGGVHWATCCLMGIEEHFWRIDNCTVVHFFIGRNGK